MVLPHPAPADGDANGWVRAAGVCHALADPVRLALLRLLARGPQVGRSLAAAAGLSPAAADRHMRVLTRHGLTGRVGRGRAAVFRLTPAVGTPPGTTFAFADGATSIRLTLALPGPEGGRQARPGRSGPPA